MSLIITDDSAWMKELTALYAFVKTHLPAEEEEGIAIDKCFKALYRRTRVASIAFLSNDLGSRADAEDLVQLAYAVLWKNRHKIKDLSRIDLYFVRVLARCKHQFLRQKDVARRQLTPLDMAHEVAYQGWAADEVIDTRMMMEDIEQAVRQLPPQQQVVFRLSKFQRLRHKEIASLLNITVSTVTNNLGIAMKKIRLLVQQRHHIKD